ncbi:MAG: ABC transporter permease, partial [Bryobacteraceae bacterium]
MRRDLRFGARTLRKHLGFTITAIVTLALGIGMNATIFSLFNSVDLKSVPARDPSRVVSLYSHVPGDSCENVYSFPEYIYTRKQNSVLSELAAYAGARVMLDNAQGASSGAGVEWLQGQLVSGNYFDLLGAVPAMGRTFLPEEDQTPGARPMVLLDYGFWQRKFGGDPAILGKTLKLNSVAYTVVGITAQGFVGADPEATDVWIPLMMAQAIHAGPPPFENRNSGWLNLMGRLKPGVTLAQAKSELAVLAARFHAQDDGRARNTTTVVTPGGFLSPSQKSDILPFAFLVMAAVGLVLMIACANVANLQLTRGVARQKEMGIRTALGASRWRLVRQMVMESLLLSGAAGVLGLFFSWWAADLLLGIAHPPGTRALQLKTSPDWHVALYLVGV